MTSIPLSFIIEHTFPTGYDSLPGARACHIYSPSGPLLSRHVSFGYIDRLDLLALFIGYILLLLW